jgi:hypothetical protein
MKMLTAVALLLVLALVLALALVDWTIPIVVKLPDGAAKQDAFPHIEVKNLADETKAFPEQFPGEKTLLLIAFEREQQDQLEDWSARLSLRAPGAPEWLELPVIDDPGAFMRWFVDVGMKGGIDDPAVRRRVFTIYAPRQDFIRIIGLPNTTQVHLVVADRSGRILCKVSGEWSEEKEKSLKSALR